MSFFKIGFVGSRIGLSKPPSSYNDHTSKFTKEDIADIRSLDLSKSTHREIADRYKVSNSTICNILNNVTYKE